MIHVILGGEDAATRERLVSGLRGDPDVRVTEVEDWSVAVQGGALPRTDRRVIVSAFPPAVTFHLLEAVAQREWVNSRSIACYPQDHRPVAFTALRLGACGVLRQPADLPRLAEAVHAVSIGRYVVDEHIYGDYASALQRFSDLREYQVALYRLTVREMDIVRCIAAGAGNKDIASECGIAEDTVKHHLSSIFRKVGVSSRLELALFAARHNLL